MQRLAPLVVAALLVAGCGADDTTDPGGEPEPAAATPEPGATSEPEPQPEPEPAAEAADTETLYPDIVAAEASQDADGTWRFDVTVSSPYDTPERYADAWRVLAPDGTELGLRELLHDHASEQPFTRSLSGVEIPDDVATVTIEGRDQVSGWGGQTVDVQLR